VHDDRTEIPFKEAARDRDGPERPVDDVCAMERREGHPPSFWSAWLLGLITFGERRSLALARSATLLEQPLELGDAGVLLPERFAQALDLGFEPNNDDTKIARGSAPLVGESEDATAGMSPASWTGAPSAQRLARGAKRSLILLNK
jgi:hypothetical protein